MSGGERTRRVAAASPGKLIVLGEYAVVFGFPALAVRTRQRCRCVINEAKHPVIRINGHEYSWEQIHHVGRSACANHALFLEGQLSVEDIHLCDHDFLAVVLFLFFQDVSLSSDKAVAIEITTGGDLPSGCGMGSSAAVACALIRAAEKNFGKKSTGYDLVLRCEGIRHGKTGGLDAWVCWHERPALLSTHGGCLSVAEAPPVPPFLIVNTGASESTTAECVAQVGAFVGGKAGNMFANYGKMLVGILRPQSMQGFSRVIREGHRLLCSLGVVPGSVQEFISAVERVGGAAKISGAGSVRGNRAGVVLVWGISAKRLEELMPPSYRLLVSG